MKGRNLSDQPKNRGQFQKGQSGNPGGRPSKQRPARGSAFDIVVDKTLSITRKGIQSDITMEEALQHRTYQDAIVGKRLAQREVLKWIAKREAWLEKHAPDQFEGRPRIRWVEPGDPDNIDQALLLLGIAGHDPARAGLDKDRAQLLLEPWAVEAALTRRRNAVPFAEKEISEIRRCTRNDEQIRFLHGMLP